MNVEAGALSTPQKAKLRVEDFLALHERGAFDRYAKTELIEGEIYCMSAIYSRHGLAQSELAVTLHQALRELDSDLRVFTAISIEMLDSAPEPDLVVARPNPKGMMPLTNVALAIEISDATLAFDLGRKAALYAGQRIPEYWVVDLDGRKLHQLWSPGAEGYAERREVALGERVEAATIAGLEVETQGV